MGQPTQELILSLPVEIAQRIEQAALRRQQSASEVVAEILSISLPPLSRRAQPPLRPLVEKMERLSRGEIERKAASWLPEDAQNRLSELLEYNRQRDLSESETTELETLLDRVQTNAIESVTAKWMLRNAASSVG